MEILWEVKDKDFPSDLLTPRIREAARAVLFDENNLVPLLFVSKYGYHKLPGGGIDVGENKIQALLREVKEEAGCEIEVMDEVGQVIEFRSESNLKQISYCYIWKIVSKGNTDFTEYELTEGFQLIWTLLEDAISKMENDKPTDYKGPFIRERDLIFLKKAQQIIAKQQ